MRLTLVLFLGCLMFSVCAQQRDTMKTKERKNQLSVEFGGKHLFYGINYERRLFQSKWHTFLGALGVGCTMPYPLAFNNSISLPINLGYYFGTKKSKLYIMAGIINLFSVYPNPKNDSLRKEVAKSPFTHVEGSMYQPKYQLYVNQSLGYAFDGKRWVLRCFIANYMFKTIYKPKQIQLQPNLGIEVGFKF